MDTEKLRQLRAAVRLVDERVRAAAAAAPSDRAEAYRLLQQWSQHDAVLSDALASVGLLLLLREDLVGQGALQRASSIDNLLASASLPAWHEVPPGDLA